MSEHALAPLPPGFPLAAADADGLALAVGTLVRIPAMPDWLLRHLPDDEADALRNYEGTTLPVLDIDRYGYLWFGEASARFCLRPGEVRGASPVGLDSA